MLTAQDLINSRNQSRKLTYNHNPTLVEVEQVVTKLNKQSTALELMRKHHKLKGTKLNRNMRESEVIRLTIKYIVGGGAFVIDGKFLNTPHAKLHI